MIIARIIGTVVASQKDERLRKKAAYLRPINLDGSDTSGYVVSRSILSAPAFMSACGRRRIKRSAGAEYERHAIDAAVVA